MKLIFGLGNPGAEYERTIHNAGWQALERLAHMLDATAFLPRREAQCATAQMGEEKVLLVKPMTYMNESGRCVADYLMYYKVQPADILVLYDDIDLPMGQVRVRASGGPGTHNGMRSIVSCISSTSFARVRMGMGPVPEYWDLVKYVLSIPRGREAELFEQAIEDGACAARCILERGIACAQRKFHTHSQKEVCTQPE